MPMTRHRLSHSPSDLPWIPPALRRPDAHVRLPAYKSLRKALRIQRSMAPSLWAERYRVITSGPFTGGLWKNAYFPYLGPILDASFHQAVRVTIVCKAPQVGGSSLLDTCLAYAADRVPGPALLVYPDRETARENMQDRIQPMIRNSPTLKKLWSGSDDDMTSLRIRLATMVVYMGWAGSATSLGNKSIMYLGLDEVDKYPLQADKREAAPVQLAEKRVTAYPWEHKIWKVSTPTVESGPIWKALTEEAHVIFDWHAVCPACGAVQVMTFDGIRWPDDNRNPEEIETRRLARYWCNSCGDLWDDHARDRAVSAGGWYARATEGECLTSLRDVLDRDRPEKIGFHLPSWLSRLVSISKIAARFLRGQKDKNLLRDFINNDKAEPWRDYTQNRAENRILALRDERPRGLVPAETDILAIAIDTQQHGFWYEVRVFKFGLEQESWQVREGFVETFEALEEILYHSEYPDTEGTRRVIAGGMIDSGGGNVEGKKHSRTAEVYDWCRRHRKIVPIKGSQSQRTPLRVSRIDHYPGTNKAIPGGLTFYTIDVNHFKDILAAKLEIAPTDPGAWHLHSEATEEYARQMCAEVTDPETGRWKCLSGRDNHFWDCGVYLLAWADLARLKHRRRDGDARPSATGRRTLSKGLRAGAE